MPHLSCRSLACRLALAGAAAAPLLAGASPAVAQLRRHMGGFPFGVPTVPAVDDDKDAPAGVTVPDSPGAVERLRQGADKEQQKEWRTAAEFYREAVAKFPGRVVPAEVDRAAHIYRYAGVASVVQERVAHWPPEGLAIYRNLYGPAAAERLASAGRGDWATLTAVFYDDFVTDAGKAAGLRLVDAYTEAGDFAAAAAVGDRLLDLHPLLGADRPAVLFRTALAHHWAGDDAAAGKRLADLKQSDPKAVGSIGGKDVVLADALATALAAPAPTPAADPAAADTYPSFGGPGGRGDTSPSTAKPGASLNTVALAPPDFSGLPSQVRPQILQADQVTLNNGGATGVMPAVDAGTLFFQDGRAVYAVDADGGTPLPAWLDTYPGDAGGRYRFSAPGRPRGEQLTLTVTPAAVLAVMGQRDRNLNPNGINGGGGFVGAMAADGSGPVSPVRLVCLDRNTGRELWKVSPADLPESAGAARASEYGGTPLSVPAAVAGTADDAVLVVARGGRDNQFDECYVVCLSARTGAYRWSTYVGSGTRTFDGESFFSQDPSQLSLAGGRAFVMTNLGTVAALDPADGRVQWLAAYARDNTESPEELMRRQQMGVATAGGNTRPWARNPVVVQGGHVFALPTDAKAILVLDAATGRQVARIATADYENADVLLGVYAAPATAKRAAHEQLILTAAQHVYGVDWRTYDHERPTQAVRLSESTVFGSGQDDTADTTDCTVVGRGFLTAGSVFVTTKRQMIQFDLRTHRVAYTYPATGKFSGGQGAGNILATGQNVVVAGQDRVDVYTDLAVVTAKYEKLMAAAPADPEPRVRFASALFAGGQHDDAVARLDEAIGLLGGRHAMRSGPGRQMVFNALLDFARRAAATAKPSGSDPDAQARALALANGLFDRAADAAESPDQRVTFLLARARFDHDVPHDYAAEVDLCQQVLSDPALRAVAVTNDQTAAAAATAEMAGAITADRSAYAAVEARATAALADARGKSDPDALLAVAEVYPNSRAAADARQSAVDQLQASGNPGRAIEVLRQMYAVAGDPSVKAAVLEAVAADFLAAGANGVGPAADRLARAAQLAGTRDPHLATDLHLPGGVVLQQGKATYTEAVDALRATLAATSAARLPDFRFPDTYPQALKLYAALHHGDRPQKVEQLSPFLPPRTVIPDVAALVHPLPAFARYDRVVTWSAGGFAVYDVGQTTPRFRAAAVAEQPTGAAWVGNRWVVWSPTRVTALTDGGGDAWPSALAMGGLPSLPSVAVSNGAVTDDLPAAADSNVVDVGQQQAIVNGQLINGQVVNGGMINVRGNVRLMIRNQQVVAVPIAPAAAAPVLVGDEQVATVQPAGPAGDVLVVATTRGRLLGLDGTRGTVRWQSRPADGPPDALLANGHFAVARLDDPGGATVIVYDVATGRVVGRRKFAADNLPGQLVNVALGEEGTLAITLAAGVEVKDLYDPWRLPPTPLVARNNADPASFAGLGQPDQLLAEAGRVVTLYDAGRFVRAWDLARPASDPTPPLGLTAPSPMATLRLDGGRLFVTQIQAVSMFNLDDPSDVRNERFSTPDGSDARIRGLLLGQRHVLAIHDPVDAGPAPSPSVTVMAMSRAVSPTTNRMDGKLDFIFPIAYRAGVSDWLGVDGGVYLLAGDHKLIFNRGGRDAAP